MRIGVISDTHGRLRPEVARCLRGVDGILHAGDFDDPTIMQQLDDIAPLYGVRGNNDWGSWAQSLPRLMRIELGGVSFCMTHKRADVPWDLTGVDIVICGHTHQYDEENVLGRLWLNPGSCSYPRPYHTAPTMAMLTIDEGGTFSVEKVEFSL